MNLRSSFLLQLVPSVLLFIALLIILSATSRSAEALEIDAEPKELYQGTETTINISVTSERDEEIRVEVYHGRQDYHGILLAIENLTVTGHQEEIFPIAFTPYLGQIDLFIYTYATLSGDDLTHITLTGIEDYSDVLLILNNNSDFSKEIGSYFLQFFDAHVVYVDAPTKETISRSEFDDVRAQIENHLEGNSLTDRINYLVTTKGVPLRVSGTGNAAFDSELTLILGQYASYIGQDSYRPNPYHNSSDRFSRDDHDIYLVTRITGYTTEEAKGIIDKSVAAYTLEGIQELSKGLAILDVDPGREGGGYKMGNDWIRAAGTLLEPKGYDVLLDRTNTFVSHRENVSLYASWGSNDGHYFIGHGKNTGMETDVNGDDIPDEWSYSEGNGDMSRTGEDKRGGGWSVRVVRDEQSGESSLLQQFFPKEGYRYYLQGYVNTTGVTDSGGVRLVIRHYDVDDDLIAEVTGSIRKGTTTAWTLLGVCHIEPVEGTAYVMFGAMMVDAEGSSYLDDIQLVEIVPNNAYLNGSLAETIVSTGGRSFTYPTSYGQSLIADIIRSGVTGVKGYVDEPYLDAIAHPDILFDRYTAGWTLAESYYTASIKLSWMDVVVGVPKLAPFALLPDLAISGLTITQDRTNSFNHTLEVMVSNQGGSSSGEWDITFSFTNGSEHWNHTLVGTSLHPGESLFLQMNWTAPSPDTYDLSVAIQHPGADQDTENDIHITSITVLSPPDLIPWDHSLNPIVPWENGSFQLTLTLKNDGESLAEDVNLSLYVDGSYVTSISVDIGGLENSFGTFPAEGYLSLPAGIHDVRIVADPSDEIRETNESNNELNVQIRINALPVPIITGNLTTRVGIPFVLDGSTSFDPDGTVQQYIWRVDGRSRVGPMLNYTFNDRGSFPVNLSVMDNDDAESETHIMVMVENTPPAPLFDLPDVPLLSFDNFTFDARQSYDNDSTPITYLWDFGDGTNSTSAIKRKAYLHPGIYQISLSVTDDLNATTTLTREITIGNREPELTIIIIQFGNIYDLGSIPAAEFLSHGAIVFDLNGTHDPDGTISSLTLSFGDGTNYTGPFGIKNPPQTRSHPVPLSLNPYPLPTRSHTYNHSGTYRITIDVRDDHGDTTSITFNLTIMNQPPHAAFSIFPPAPDSHAPLRLESSAWDNGEILSYQWNIEGVNMSGPSVTHVFTVYGYFSIIHTVIDDEGLMDSWEERIFIHDIPADISAADVYATEGVEVRIHWNATDRDGAISHYLVTFQDGTVLNLSVTYLDHVFRAPGIYHLNITVVDDYGLTNTTTISVYVTQKPDDPGFISLPQVFPAILAAVGLTLIGSRRRAA